MVCRDVFRLFCLIVFSAAARGQQMDCGVAELSKSQVENIIARARASRTDLPSPFSESRTELRKQGCHYTFIEFGLPQAPELLNIFKLNRNGILVDFEPGTPKCPDQVIQQPELERIVANERARRPDLPKPFPQSRKRVDRLRCLYQIFEYSIPESRGNYQVFTIDQFGELMDFQRASPY